jgi:hypothetical protein
MFIGSAATPPAHRSSSRERVELGRPGIRAGRSRRQSRKLHRCTSASVTRSGAVGRLTQIVVDSRHPASLARFWAAALDDFELLPYDEAEVARLASHGLTPETDTCVIVIGPGIEFGFQQAEVVDVPKKPMHLDISVADHDAEAERLVGLGATVRQRFEEHTWMLDPEGNDFCVTNESQRP